MFETLIKDITQKSQILVNLLLNGKKSSFEQTRVLRPSWITLYSGRQSPGGRAGSWITKEIKEGLEHQLRCLSHTTEAVILPARHLAISGPHKTLSGITLASCV